MQVKGIDQITLANAAGYNKSVVSNWVNGRTKVPSLEALRRTAEALQVPMGEALVAAEYITADEIGATTLPADLASVDTGELIREIGARLGYDLAISGKASPARLRAVAQWGDKSIPPPSRDDVGVAADSDE
ncbi:Transcriptional regulator, contains XRE-family HTH domain [Rhodococcoides kroppenstedtii]|uniref:Transcriptional regulator, contains XRE-family HTH domain n=2 Tax=Rhodococcoides kroppenstedtii TaxID=293050 RepID=A0A1I0SHG6_9NOCA|nr:Transcriptional regulator, contains XRE-family HTH domain [Rhodococcus kroppenstedtii]